MRRKSSRIALALTVSLLCFASIGFADDHTPKPYSTDEFQEWMKKLWRADVIAVGSFPFTIFATFEVYDTWRYVYNGLNSSSGFNIKYAPWPFGSGSTAGYTTAETTWLAVSAVSLSVIIAGIDFILGQVNATPPHG